MAKSRIVIYIACLFFFIVACNGSTNVEEKSEYAPFFRELNPIISPVSPDPTSSLEDLSSLNYLGNSQIVGLGEATHGTKEFFQFKHKIFKYLVKNHDFKAFAFEADMAESYYFDQYVTKGEGDLSKLMDEKMHFWTWNTESVKALLEWMRTYNEGRSADEKIHYIGIDTQYMTFQPEILKDYLQDTAPYLLEEVSPVLDSLSTIHKGNHSMISQRYDTMSTSYKNYINQRLDEAIQNFDENKSALIAASSDFKFEFMRQLLRNCQQTNNVDFQRSEEINNPFHSRDKYMAENTLWVSKQFGQIALWAHNAHVADDPSGLPSQGYYLKEAIGKDYQIIGFSFAKGIFRGVSINYYGESRGLDVQTIDEKPKEGSINWIFHKLEEENFVLKIDNLAKGSPFSKWLETPRGFLSIGATYNSYADYYKPIAIKQLFDVLIHVDHSTNTVSVSPFFNKINAPSTNFSQAPYPLLMDKKADMPSPSAL